MKSNSNQSRRRWWSGTRRRMLSRAGRAVGMSHADGRGVEALEPRVHLAVIVWDGGPDGLGTDFNDPVNWDGDVLPGAEDDAVIPDMPGSLVITITQNAALNSLTSAEAITHSAGTLTLLSFAEFNAPYLMTGGTIDGIGSVTMNSSFDLRAGTTLAAGGELSIGAGGSLVLSTTSGSRSIARDVRNFGNVNWLQGEIELSGATFTNELSGVMTVASSATVRSVGAGTTFVNAGLIHKAGSGILRFTQSSGQMIQVTNTADGVIALNAGTVQASLNSGSSFANLGEITLASGVVFHMATTGLFTSPTGSTIAGSGTFRVSGGTAQVGGTFDVPAWDVLGGQLTLGLGSYEVASLAVSGGNLNGAGSVSVTGIATLGGASAVIAGTGSMTVHAGAVMTIVAGTLASISRDLDVLGTLQASGSGITLRIFNGTVAIRPGGLFDISVPIPGSMVITGPAVTGHQAGSLVNEGVISRTGPGPLSFDSSGGVTNTYVNEASGIINVLQGVTSSGFLQSFANAGVINISAGAEFQPGELSIIAGSQVAGQGRLETRAVANGSVQLIVENVGLRGVSGPGTLTVDSHDVQFMSASCSADVLVSATTVSFQSGSGGAGNVTIVSGSITWPNFAAWSGTGVLTIGSGASLAFTGANATVARPLIVEGAASANSTNLTVSAAGSVLVAGTWDLLGGSILGDGTVAIDGQFNWSGGSMSGAGTFTINVGGALLLSAPAATISRPLVNLGTVTHNGTILTIPSGTTVSTSGTWNFNSGQITGTGEFAINGGTFNQTGGIFAGTGPLTIGPGASARIEGTLTRGLHNYGTVFLISSGLTLTNADNLNAGTIYLFQSVLDLSNAPMTHLGGSHITFEASDSLNLILGSAQRPSRKAWSPGMWATDSSTSMRAATSPARAISAWSAPFSFSTT